MANKISITKLESDVIGNGFGKSNFNTEGNPVWANSLIEGCKLCTIKQLPGVVSSLVKKGLALAEGEGKEKTVALTDEGKVILKRLVSVDSPEPIVEPVIAEETKTEDKPKKQNNMTMARLVLESGGKMELEHAVDELLKVHTLRTSNPRPQARKIFLHASAYGLPVKITKEDKVKYVELLAVQENL